MRREEHTHTIRIIKSTVHTDIYHVDFHCSFTRTGSLEALASFRDVHRAYEYAKWQSEKRGLGIRFEDGVERLIFPEAYEDKKSKKKKKKRRSKR